MSWTLIASEGHPTHRRSSTLSIQFTVVMYDFWDMSGLLMLIPLKVTSIVDFHCFTICFVTKTYVICSRFSFLHLAYSDSLFRVMFFAQVVINSFFQTVSQPKIQKEIPANAYMTNVVFTSLSSLVSTLAGPLILRS